MGENINYMRRQEAADYLKSKYKCGSAATLAKLASIGGGPPFQKYGRYPVYARDHLDAWAQARLSPIVNSTSEFVVV